LHPIIYNVLFNYILYSTCALPHCIKHVCDSFIDGRHLNGFSN